MQSSQQRSLILIAVLLAGWGILTATNPAEAAEPRWPASDSLYAVDGWAMGPASVENPYFATHIVTRRYVRNGVTAFVRVKTDPEAKNIYRTGAEVEFQGAGYTIEPVTADLAQPSPGQGALVATRKNERLLVLYAFGERRGLLGNGGQAWSLVVLDKLLGHPNDYYYLSVVVRLDGLESAQAAEAVALADTIFPRVAGWYAN